jgi:hypothetical protein
MLDDFGGLHQPEDSQWSNSLQDFGPMQLHRGGTEESFPELLQEVLLDSANVWAYGIYS